MQHLSPNLGHFSITSLLWGQHSNRQTCSHCLPLTRSTGRVLWTRFRSFGTHIACQPLAPPLLYPFFSFSSLCPTPTQVTGPWWLLWPLGFLKYKRCPTYFNFPHPQIYATSTSLFTLHGSKCLNHRSLCIVPVCMITCENTQHVSPIPSLPHGFPFQNIKYRHSQIFGTLGPFGTWI